MKKTVVFQGDSITDAGRFNDGVGTGYVKLVYEYMSKNYPDITCYNRGISGNRTIDLVNRWKEDTMDLQPDIVTVMIGINDIWRFFDCGDQTSDNDFEQNYRCILSQLKDKGIKIIMLAPFKFECGVVTGAWQVEFDAKLKIVQKLAKEFADIYIPLNQIFENLEKFMEGSAFAADGVHLTLTGSMVVSSALIEAIEQLLK